MSEEKIKELCGLIPSEAKTLLEAVLINVDFSCLSSEDFVCRLAADIVDKLINSFRDSKTTKIGYAINLKDTSVPIVREIEGTLRYIHNREQLNEIGCVTIEFREF